MISFAGLASRGVSFLSFAVWVWLSEQPSQKHTKQNTKQNKKEPLANTKSAGYRICQVSAGLHAFPFSPGPLLGRGSQSVGPSASQAPQTAAESEKNAAEWKGGGDWRGRTERARDTERQRAEAEKLRENVIWSGCFGPHAPFALPHGAGRVTSIGRN